MDSAAGYARSTSRKNKGSASTAFCFALTHSGADNAYAQSLPGDMKGLCVQPVPGRVGSSQFTKQQK